MTTQDLNKIIAAIQPLDQFASQTPLPRPWHAQWQTIFQQVVTNVQAVPTEEARAADAAEEPADTGKTPPG